CIMPMVERLKVSIWLLNAASSCLMRHWAVLAVVHSPRVQLEIFQPLNWLNIFTSKASKLASMKSSSMQSPRPQCRWLMPVKKSQDNGASNDRTVLRRKTIDYRIKAPTQTALRVDSFHRG